MQILYFNFKLNCIELNSQVEQYLAEYVTKPLHPPSTLLALSGAKSLKLLQRRMSVKGAIKKTRSIISADGIAFIIYDVLSQIIKIMYKHHLIL